MPRTNPAASNGPTSPSKAEIVRGACEKLRHCGVPILYLVALANYLKRPRPGLPPLPFERVARQLETHNAWDNLDRPLGSTEGRIRRFPPAERFRCDRHRTALILRGRRRPGWIYSCGSCGKERVAPKKLSPSEQFTCHGPMTCKGRSLSGWLYECPEPACGYQRILPASKGALGLASGARVQTAREALYTRFVAAICCLCERPRPWNSIAALLLAMEAVPLEKRHDLAADLSRTARRFHALFSPASAKQIRHEARIWTRPLP